MQNPSQTQQLMLFTEDSLDLASRSPWLATGADGMTRVSCGLSFRAWSESLSRVGWWVRTYLESCPLPGMRFARIWSLRATKSGYGILKLRLSEPRTEGNGCFLWRTPDAGCAQGAQSKERFAESKIMGRPLVLNDQVAHMFPTPTAQDAKNNAAPSQFERNSAPLNVVAGGSLNPEWVELLMGFPRGWTEAGTE